VGDHQFDELTRALATAPNRRAALKALASMVGGSVLGLVGLQETAEARRCKLVGKKCRQDAECCDFFCDPATGRCVCPPGTNLCQRTGQCVQCSFGQSFDAATCRCGCPSGTSACGPTACCPPGSPCCESSGYFFCCPPGTICRPSPYGGAFCS
jgi:hypothetical protein